jgi:16S rRNA (cytosine967-C5)-methyltransferase
MPVAPARTAAFGALLAVERGAWSAEALAAKSAHLDSRDAGLASDILFGVLRHRGELAALMEQAARRAPGRLDPPVRLALEMGIYQLRFLDRVPAHAAVNDSVELVRRANKSSAASFVNAVLRRIARENFTVAESASTPAWLLERWTKTYGAETALAIAKASLQPPERYIRVGAAPPPEGAEPTEVPGAFVLSSGDAGPFRFQDIGSQAVVPLLELQPGQTFLDLCAAPGNKTAQALEIAVRAVACDLHLSRARTLVPLGIPVAVLDATKPLPFARTFDRILVDAPCSGTGTLARNPEIKWRLRPEDLADLHQRQTAILRNALAALSPGGILVYATCSLEPEENEQVVDASGAQVVGTMKRVPGRDLGDGFFAAALHSTTRVDSGKERP